MLASRMRPLEPASGQKFDSRAKIELSFQAPAGASRAYALYLEGAATSSWQKWVDYDEVRVESIRAPNSRFHRRIDPNAFRILFDCSGSMTKLFGPTAKSLVRQFTAIGPEMQARLTPSTPKKPLFLFSEKAVGPLRLHGLETYSGSGGTNVIAGLNAMRVSQLPKKPWVMLIVSDFCGTCFDESAFGKELFLEKEGRLAINAAKWPDLAEVHLIAVNDILGGANPCNPPSWMQKTFAEGSAARSGQETTVFYARPAKVEQLDRLLGDFLGQIRMTVQASR